MKKVLASAVLFFGFIILFGCSTSQVNLNDAKSAPNDRILKYQTEFQDSAQITVIRDKGIVLSGCFAGLYVNGELVAKLDTSEKVTLYLPSGEVILGTKAVGRGLCNSSIVYDRSDREFILKANSNKYYRIFTDQNANMDIKPMLFN